jgi:SAM-dependent methyltransferase
LSLNSLSYAKRQAQDLGIENIEFLQADILDLDNLDRQFHIIESLGTLHHMCDPMLGWKVLSDCLSVGGLMRISLYSKLARLNVTNLRNQIRKENINSDIPGIKSFRNYLMGAEIVGYENILESIDFFSLSAIRDLLFHEQEHQFTQKQIKKCLFDLNLEFCGYQQEPFVTRFRVLNQHLNDDCDLDKWHDFEEKYPFIFGNTPAFWCQKI